MTASATMTLRLSPTLKGRLEKLSTLTHRSKSVLAQEAIREYVRVNEWHINEIKKGRAEVERGELIPHEEIIRKLEKKLANSLDKNR